MKKNITSIFLIAISCLLFVSCEKEQVADNVAAPLSKVEIAKYYLGQSPTMVNFAILTLNHDTYEINGFVLDKKSNLREINMQEATFLDFSEPNLSNYFTERMFQKSNPVEEIDVEVMADNVKAARKLVQHDAQTTNPNNGVTSKIYLAFNPDYSVADHEGCAMDNRTTTTRVTKLILSANGLLNYTPTSKQELELVNWLKSFENEVVTADN